jgi:hypothetical protein
VLAGDGREGLHPQAPVPVGGTPAAITAFDYAGDELDDLIVGDATGTLRTVVLGDRAISRTRGADQLNAQGRRRVLVAARRARLGGGARDADGARLLPVAAVAKSVFLHLGRDPRGRREATYARCGTRRRCRVESL